MAGNVNVFNVEFGINDTPLTRCLENRDFDEALHYVESGFWFSLDDGCYQRTPLFIVLSGETSEFDGRTMPVHLALARKLIERGADPNLRVPQTCGAEYIGPGRSPLECVVEFFNFLTRRDQYHSMRCQIIPAYKAISLTGRTHISAGELAEELIDVMWLLLGHGAKVNVRDAESKTPLHNTLLRSGDIRMAQTLTDNDADINAVDCYGNTPLMSVCCPLPWRDYGDYGPSVKKQDITEAVQYLLQFDTIKVDHLGPHNRSALFYAMQAGNLGVARILLKHGANPSIRGMGPDGRNISPLLAALVPWPSIGRDHKDMKYRLRQLASLVDGGFFNMTEFLKEILEYAAVERSGDTALTRLRRLDMALVSLTFGCFSCSLAQLSARSFISATYPTQTFKSLSTSDILATVTRLGLPRICVMHFQVVLLREKILSSLAEMDWDEWSMEEFSEDSNDESDGEYW